MAEVLCARCGDPTPSALMQPGKQWCRVCHQTDDLDRHAPADIPFALRVEKLLNDKIGVQCPYKGCGHKVQRNRGYFTKRKQLERCPRCLGHYYVRKGGAK